MRHASVRTDEARDAGVLGKMREAYASSAPTVSTQRPDYWGLVFESRLARFAAAAVILLSLIIVVGQFGAFIAGGNVVWAHWSPVAERRTIRDSALALEEGEPWR